MKLAQAPLIRFLKEENRRSLYYIATMSVISGTAGGAILALINMAASIETGEGQATDGKHRLLLLFVVALVTMIVTEQLSVYRSVKTLETILGRLRMRICDKIRRSEMEDLEQLNEEEIVTTMTRDMATISTAGRKVAYLWQQSLLLLAGIVYIAFLSKIALFLFAISGLISAGYYYAHVRELKETYRKQHKKEAEFLAHLRHLLDGFKEIRLSEIKSQQILADTTVVSGDMKASSIRTGAFFARSSVIFGASFYLVLAAVVFIMPQLSPTYAEMVERTAIAVMFVFEPLASVIYTIPQLSDADASLDNLYRLEKALDENLPDAGVAEHRGLFRDFRRVALESIEFAYKDKDGARGFSVGPINLEFHRREILFLTGGNGSGKTTLLKLLTGLYHPQAGTLSVDGHLITGNNRQEHRELFAGVFADFCLFPRLYGIDQIDQQSARGLLELMQIAHKVDIVDGRFTTLDLSTGQRKRLALIAAILEDRPIYVFDEWTADQDPEFRKHFYRTIVPDMREQGKTIIAITHDDRYWDTADRLVKLDYGKIDSIEIPG